MGEELTVRLISRLTNSSVYIRLSCKLFDYINAIITSASVGTRYCQMNLHEDCEMKT